MRVEVRSRVYRYPGIFLDGLRKTITGLAAEIRTHHLLDTYDIVRRLVTSI
jgi:hypothetical protein